MVFVHVPRSEDTSSEEVNEGSSAHNIVHAPNNASTSITIENSQSSEVSNIILNHDFSQGLKSWKVTSKGGYVVPKGSDYLENILPYSGVHYLVINGRRTMYDGLEQVITERLSVNVEYTFSAWVRLYGGYLGAEDKPEVRPSEKKDKPEVRAMLRLDSTDKMLTADADWVLLASEFVSTNGWTNFSGRHTFEHIPKRVILFFEGPHQASLDVLIDSVVMSPSVV